MGRDAAQVSLEALTPEGLDAFASLLGAPCFGGCFCAVWTSFDETWAARCADPARPNLERTRRDVLAGRRAGFFVRIDGQRAGWIGAGPRTAFPLMADKLASRRGQHTSDTWAVGCLAFLPAFRGRGLGEQAVRAVVALAQRSGATRIEAFPTRPWDEPRSYRGAASMFARVGFEVEHAERDGSAEILLMALSLV